MYKVELKVSKRHQYLDEREVDSDDYFTSFFATKWYLEYCRNHYMEAHCGVLEGHCERLHGSL
jgi:hypothetical protein